MGIDFKVKTVYRHDKRIKLQIWVGQAAVYGSAGPGRDWDSSGEAQARV